MLAVAALETFTQTGFQAALIQRRGGTEKYLDTAWTVQAIRGLVLAIALFALAPTVGRFFEEPRASSLLRLMCLSVALSGFANIGIIYFRKDLQFHKQVLFTTGSAVVRLAVGVVLAYYLRSVWALVWAGLAHAAISCLLSYVLHPFRPRVSLKPTQVADLFRFGRWLLGSSIVIFMASQGDKAFIGKVLGVAALGIYQLAFRLCNLVAGEITHTTSAVVFPAYSKIHLDKERLRRAYHRVLRSILLLAVPMAAGIAFFAPELITLTLGEKWAAAIPLVPILAAQALIRALAATGGPLYLAAGHPNYSFWTNVVRVSVLAVTIYPLASAYGLAGVCISTLLAHAAMLPLWVIFIRRILGLKLRQYAGVFLEPTAVAALLAAPACGALGLWGRHEPLMLLAGGVGLAAGCLFVFVRRASAWKRVVLSSWS